MKIILTQQIAKLGERGDIVEVKNGYALNFLIPKGLALPAIKDNIKKIRKEKAIKEAEKRVARKKEENIEKEKKSKREKRIERKQAEKIKYQKAK